jgi:hypothetical protein
LSVYRNIEEKWGKSNRAETKVPLNMLDHSLPAKKMILFKKKFIWGGKAPALNTILSNMMIK